MFSSLPLSVQGGSEWSTTCFVQGVPSDGKNGIDQVGVMNILTMIIYIYQ